MTALVSCTAPQWHYSDMSQSSAGARTEAALQQSYNGAEGSRLSHSPAVAAWTASSTGTRASSNARRASLVADLRSRAARRGRSLGRNRHARTKGLRAAPCFGEHNDFTFRLGHCWTALLKEGDTLTRRASTLSAVQVRGVKDRAASSTPEVLWPPPRLPGLEQQVILVARGVSAPRSILQVHARRISGPGRVLQVHARRGRRPRRCVLLRRVQLQVHKPQQLVPAAQLLQAPARRAPPRPVAVAATTGLHLTATVALHWWQPRQHRRGASLVMH